MSRTLTAIAAAAVIAGASFADEETALSSQEKRARRKARIEARVAAEGGMVRKDNVANFARVVNCQKKVSSNFIRDVVAQFNTGLNIYVEVVDMDFLSDPLELANKAMSIPRTGIAAIIVDDDRLPTILSAMESGWSILNIRHLRDDLPPKAVYELRLSKEINRAFAEAAGAGLSFNRPCVMEPVYKLSDLDAIKFPIVSPEAMGKISQACAKRGIPPVRSDTYHNACSEGWAPAPTNDVQRAIWDKVHKIPDRPLTIEYDPKRDR